MDGDRFFKQQANVVIAHAEAGWKDQTADADDQTTDCGPPHPMHGQLMEDVFGSIDAEGEESGKCSGHKTDQCAAEQAAGSDEGWVLGGREERSQAQNVAAGSSRSRTCQSYRKHAARFPFK